MGRQARLTAEAGEDRIDSDALVERVAQAIYGVVYLEAQGDLPPWRDVPSLARLREHWRARAAIAAIREAGVLSLAEDRDLGDRLG